MQDMHIKEIPLVVRTFYLECVTGGSQAMKAYAVYRDGQVKIITSKQKRRERFQRVKSL